MAGELKPCGTNAAYVRHVKHGEPTCQPCRDAHAAYIRGDYQLAAVTPHEAAECGSTGGYGRHRWRGEVPCKDCCAAVAKQHREYRARRKLAAADVAA